MLSPEVQPTCEEYFMDVLMNRPSDVIGYSLQWFDSERGGNGENVGVSHAYRSLRYLVHTSESFVGKVCQIFCEELATMGDAEADEISVQALQASLKRFLECEVRASGDAVVESMAALEAAISEQIPVMGTISFRDFVAYMRFAAGNVAMRAWLHRLYLFSAEINDGHRLPRFNPNRLRENLTHPSAALRCEGNVDASPWIAFVLDLLDSGKIPPVSNTAGENGEETKGALTCDTIFSAYLQHLVQKALALCPDTD